MVANDLVASYNFRAKDILIEDLQKKMSKETFRNYAKNIGMKLGPMENFILMADDFNKKFLTGDNFKEEIVSLIDGNRKNY
jgi:hypothetical protein